MQNHVKKNGPKSALTEIDPVFELQKNDTINKKNKQEKITNIHFLSSGNQLPKDYIYILGNDTLGKDTGNDKEQHLVDIKTLSASALRKKYPRTYKCWDNMKQRKKIGAIIHKDFASFKDFLFYVGPCEDKNYTLDRLDNNDPEYAPGKVEWRDKYARNSNKGNNVFLTHDDGRSYIIAHWAKITNQKPATLYKRKAEGWLDMEIITGVKDSQTLSDVENPFPYKKKEAWEFHYGKALITGSKDSKLQFLNWKSHSLIAANQYDACEISNEISSLEFYDPDNEDIPILTEKLDTVTANYMNFSIIYHESSQLLRYEEKKQAYLDSINPIKALKKKCIEHFETLYQRPKYTINKPDYKTPELL